MKNLVLIAVVGISVILMFSGCGQTPKEEVTALIYDSGVNEQGLSEERAKCVADKTVEKLSEEDLITMVKIHDLKEDGKEGEIQASGKNRAALYTFVQQAMVATSECDQ